jgi:hypothetical protein
MTMAFSVSEPTATESPGLIVRLLKNANGNGDPAGMTGLPGAPVTLVHVSSPAVT